LVSRQLVAVRGLAQAIAAELGGLVEWSFTLAGCCANLEFPAGGTNFAGIDEQVSACRAAQAGETKKG
jgi:hypothetical protein